MTLLVVEAIVALVAVLVLIAYLWTNSEQVS